MLDTLRRGAQGWVAKFLLILLVGSFAVWGISGSILNAQSNAVVTAGQTTVTPTEFRLAWERQLALVSRQAGQRITTEQARALGLENQVFSQLIAGAVLDEQARELDLGLSKSRLATLIGEDPVFHGPSGSFDRATMQQVLRSAGLSEEDYIENRSAVAVRTQIVEAISEGFVAPDAMISALASYETESRDLAYLVLTPSLLAPVADPDDATLSAWFEENKARFAAPEYRKITYVKLEPADIADPATITEAAAREDYERVKSRYSEAETRTVDQLTFPDQAAADKASADLAAGKTFDEIAGELGRKPEDLRIGTFTKANYPDQSLAETVFSIAEEGGVSPVAKGLFGPVILRVAAIKPESVKTFEDVEQEIRQELALVEANDIILDVHDAYEDARAGGMTLAEAAAQQKLTPVTVEAIDRSGRAPDGTIINTLPESQALLAAAFDADPGVETPPLTVGRDGFLWFEVVSVTPERDRTLDEVRDDAVAAWKSEQQAEALAVKASELKERARNGETLDAIAAELSIAVENAYGVRRGDNNPVLGEASVSAAFSGPQGLVETAADATGENRILLRVVTVSGSIAGADAVPAEQRDAVARQVGDDLLDQMASRLQSDYAVTINRTVAERALAGF